MKFFETDEERFEFLKWMSVSVRYCSLGCRPRVSANVRRSNGFSLFVIKEQPNIDRHVKRMADDPFLTIKDFYMQHGTFLNIYDDSVEETDEIKTIKDKRKLLQIQRNE